MSFQNFLNKSIIIARLSTVSGYKKNYVTTATIDAHLQKITDEETEAIYGVFGATHQAWLDISEDIKKGDKVTDPDGNVFIVVAINKQDFGNMVQHLEIFLKEYNA